MVTSHDILWAIVAPAAIALIAIVLAHLVRGGRRDTHAWGVPLAVAVGLSIAYIGVAGRITFPPKRGQEWLIFAAAAAVLISIVASIPLPIGWSVTGLSILLLLPTTWLLCANRVKNLPSPEAWITLAFIASGLIVWWASMEPLASRYRGFTLPLLLSGVAGAAALVIIDGGSRDVGLIEGGIAVVLLVVALMAFWLRDLSLAGGGILAIDIVVMGLLVAGYLYADVTWVQAAILAIAPLFAWVGAMPIIRTRRPWVRFAIVAVIALAIVAVAAVPAAQGLRKTLKEQTESTMY